MRKDKLFIDTNAMLDLLGERIPFYEPMARIATLADQGKIDLIVSALSFSTVNYLLTKFESTESVREKLRKFKILVEVSDLTSIIIDKSLTSNFPDFEDALQYHCALNKKCNILITRNGKDFKLSDIPIFTPQEYINILIHNK